MLPQQNLKPEFSQKTSERHFQHRKMTLAVRQVRQHKRLLHAPSFAYSFVQGEQHEDTTPAADRGSGSNCLHQG